MVSEIGPLVLPDHSLLEELLYNVENTPEVSDAFYQTYYLPLLQAVFEVLTDTFHKAGMHFSIA